MLYIVILKVTIPLKYSNFLSGFLIMRIPNRRLKPEQCIFKAIHCSFLSLLPFVYGDLNFVRVIKKDRKERKKEGKKQTNTEKRKLC